MYQMQIIDSFCTEMMTEMYTYALRQQMVQIISSTLNLLKNILMLNNLVYHCFDVF